MYYQALMNDQEKDIQREVRRFVRNEVSPDLIRALDRDEIKYPREYVENLAAHNLLGLRFDPKWGGRGLPWTAEVVVGEEVGVLGTTLSCAFVMPSIVGEALHVFGTDEHKERFLKPILQGKLISAEALTEPRGGSDFFGATTRAEIDGDHFVLNVTDKSASWWGPPRPMSFWSIVEPTLVKTFTNTNASARLWLKRVPASRRSTTMG